MRVNLVEGEFERLENWILVVRNHLLGVELLFSTPILQSKTKYLVHFGTRKRAGPTVGSVPNIIPVCRGTSLTRNSLTPQGPPQRSRHSPTVWSYVGGCFS